MNFQHPSPQYPFPFAYYPTMVRSFELQGFGPLGVITYSITLWYVYCTMYTLYRVTCIYLLYLCYRKKNMVRPDRQLLRCMSVTINTYQPKIITETRRKIEDLCRYTVLYSYNRVSHFFADSIFSFFNQATVKWVLLAKGELCFDIRKHKKRCKIWEKLSS